LEELAAAILEIVSKLADLGQQERDAADSFDMYLVVAHNFD
jgi:hypothetical protein